LFLSSRRYQLLPPKCRCTASEFVEKLAEEGLASLQSSTGRVEMGSERAHIASHDLREHPKVTALKLVKGFFNALP
jgi:hypothetical protein